MIAIAVLMVLSIVVPLALGVPIAAALGLAGAAWLVYLDSAQFVYLKGAASAVWNSSESYTLMSVPLFILMGELMQRTDLSRRFYYALSRCLSRLSGGALYANVATCATVAAVSGSSVATAAMVGAAAIPSLLRLGYDRKLVFGTIAAGGTLGNLIPPSIPLIIYAALVDESVGRLFMGALIPGLMMTGIFFIYVFFRSRNLPAIPHQEKSEQGVLRDVFAIILDILPFALIFVVIFGGLYLGWVTPTEVAGLGVMIVGIAAAIIRQLRWSNIKGAVVATVTTTSVILLVVIGAQIFSFALYSIGIPSALATWVGTLSINPLSVLVVIIVMYMILGMFIDPISMMVLTLGVVFPIITQLGYDPIWFGVLMVMLIEIGLITPPVGINLFTIQSIHRGTTLSEVSIGSLPFVGMFLLGIVLIVAFPEIVLWLPNMMFN